MKKLLFTITFTCLFIAFAFAQKGYTEVNYVSNSQGLPGSFASSVDFDGSGNTWMGFGRKFPLVSVGGGGVAMWNGQSLTKFNTSNSALQSNIVYSLLCDNTYIWVGTDAGLQRVVASSNFLVSANYPALKSKGLGTKITALKKTGNHLWIGSDNGAGKLDVATDSFTYYSGSLWGKPGALVYAIAEGNNGDMWLGTNGGVVKIGANNTYSVYDTSNSGLKNNTVYSLLWKNNDLWIGSDVASFPNEYLGLSVLRAGTIYPAGEVLNCGYKELAGLTGRVFHLETEKISGDIYATMGAYMPHPVSSPSFIRIRGNKISKYFIKTTTNQNVTASAYVPLYIRQMPVTGDLWLGPHNNKAFSIDNINRVGNEDENLGLLLNADPKTLDINQVGALLHGNGDMFWDLLGKSRYEVPKNTCKSPLFASALWMGGLDNGGNLHTAAMTYRQSGIDFFPGPLDTITATAPVNGDSSYLKIWKITSNEINLFKVRHADGSLANGTYTPPADFISWPAHGGGNYSKQLAPFVDTDNNGLYEPMKGDYPKIKGNQALYWIFNDAGNIHSETQGLPLGVEVHAMAYAFNCDSIKPGSPNEALNFTTFYEYEIVNRSLNKYDSTYFSLWTDVELGNYADDYVGCSPQNNFAFVYNGDNDDEGPFGYGTNPPMLSILFLTDKMDNFMAYDGDFSVTGSPSINQHYYYLMQSRYKDGSRPVIPIGPDSGQTSNYSFSGTPYTAGEWNEAEAGIAKGDRRFLQSTGPYTFKPGEVKKFGYAIIYSHLPGQPNGLNTSWAKNLNDVGTVKNWHQTQSFPSCPTESERLSVNESISGQNGVKLYPNPTTGNTIIEFELKDNATVTLEVYNLLGKKVLETQNNLDAGMQFLQANLGGQPAGVYVYVLKSGNSRFSGKIIKLGE